MLPPPCCLLWVSGWLSTCPGRASGLSSLPCVGAAWLRFLLVLLARPRSSFGSSGLPHSASWDPASSPPPSLLGPVLSTRPFPEGSSHSRLPLADGISSLPPCPLITSVSSLSLGDGKFLKEQKRCPGPAPTTPCYPQFHSLPSLTPRRPNRPTAPRLVRRQAQSWGVLGPGGESRLGAPRVRAGPSIPGLGLPWPPLGAHLCPPGCSALGQEAGPLGLMDSQVIAGFSAPLEAKEPSPYSSCH